jgi:signal transduction histidine kinase
VRRVALAHADPAKEEMAYDYLRRYPPEPNADSAVNVVMRTLQPLLVPEITEEMLEKAALNPEQLAFIRELRPTSSMTVPLLAHNKALGAITLLTAESGLHFGADDQALAEEIARRAAMAIENARLYKESETARSEAEMVGHELKEAVGELRRSNEELQQFAYVASHDLQEPLRMVASYTQLLAKRYKGKLDSDADEFIMYAVDGANRMQRLINDLLAYSRVSTRGKAFELTDCELVLDQALANLQTAIGESEAVITHDPLPTFMGDHTQLTQLFQNLVGNALKFHGEEPPRVHIGVERADHDWLFCIRDNGIGIEPQYVDRIFVIFQRLHSKTDYPGTGIGLAICKKVVERHGGRIWVESQPNQGSTFYFAIPNSEA